MCVGAGAAAAAPTAAAIIAASALFFASYSDKSTCCGCGGARAADIIVAGRVRRAAGEPARAPASRPAAAADAYARVASVGRAKPLPGVGVVRVAPPRSVDAGVASVAVGGRVAVRATESRSAYAASRRFASAAAALALGRGAPHGRCAGGCGGGTAVAPLEGGVAADANEFAGAPRADASALRSVDRASSADCAGGIGCVVAVGSAGRRVGRGAGWTSAAIVVPSGIESASTHHVSTGLTAGAGPSVAHAGTVSRVRARGSDDAASASPRRASAADAMLRARGDAGDGADAAPRAARASSTAWTSSQSDEPRHLKTRSKRAVPAAARAACAASAAGPVGTNARRAS